jgi:protein-L-isoaspartate(D-aspartate) O-methyltransferase
MSNNFPKIHNTMEELCDELEYGQDHWIKTKKVREAMMNVDRADFAPSYPYQNFPQPIPCSVVISAPLLHAYCLEALKNHLIEGSTALDIGFGSGYLTVAMSKMMNDKGKVIGIEHMKELYALGEKNISIHHKNLLDTKRIELFLGDGRKGLKERAPFNCIHVGAAAERPPQELLDQLAVGGRLVIPLGTKDENHCNQFIYFIDKLPNGTFNYVQGLSVRYVNLTSVDKQKQGIV